jgi:single-stranded DNA-binding protein
MSNLQPTYGQFVVKGFVVGLSNEKAFTEGAKEGGNPWKKVQFGVKVNDNSVVYVELMGSKMKNVNFVYRDPNDKKTKKDKTIQVLWADRYKERKDNFEISMPIGAGLERGEDGKKSKENKKLVAYDAVEYVKKYLKDGDTVYIRGALQITEYQGKAQEKYVIQSIYLSNDALDFTAEGYEQEASFNQEIVYLGTQENEENEKTLINSYIIYKKDGSLTYLPYSFVVNHGKYKGNKEKQEQLRNVVNYFENEIPSGSTVKVNGDIAVYVEKAKAENTGATFGFNAKGQDTVIRGTTIRELEITGGDVGSIIKERYSEDDFLAANANQNPFGDQGSVDISDDELPF